jgi:hypothetical protein
MKFFKKVSAGILLSFGFLFLMVGMAELSEKDRDSDSAIWGCLALGVPMLAGGGWIVWGLDRKYRKQLESKKKQEDDRLNSIFFRLLKEEKGRVTTLQMAMEAQISGEEARDYLDRKAKEFEATFDVGDHGEIFYLFNS